MVHTFLYILKGRNPWISYFIFYIGHKNKIAVAGIMGRIKACGTEIGEGLEPVHLSGMIFINVNDHRVLICRIVICWIYENIFTGASVFQGEFYQFLIPPFHDIFVLIGMNEGCGFICFPIVKN